MKLSSKTDSLDHSFELLNNYKYPSSFSGILTRQGNFIVINILGVKIWMRNGPTIVLFTITTGIAITSWIMNSQFMGPKWKITHLLFAVVYYFLIYKAIFSDPGVIPARQIPNFQHKFSKIVLDESSDDENLETEDEKLTLNRIGKDLDSELDPIACTICNLPESAKGTHCDICKFCVKDLDHHCSVLKICIAKNNKNYIYAFLIWFHMCFYALGYQYYDLYFSGTITDFIKFMIRFVKV